LGFRSPEGSGEWHVLAGGAGTGVNPLIGLYCKDDLPAVVRKSLELSSA